MRIVSTNLLLLLLQRWRRRRRQSNKISSVALQQRRFHNTSASKLLHTRNASECQILRVDTKFFVAKAPRHNKQPNPLTHNEQSNPPRTQTQQTINQTNNPNKHTHTHTRTTTTTTTKLPPPPPQLLHHIHNKTLAKQNLVWDFCTHTFLLSLSPPFGGTFVNAHSFLQQRKGELYLGYYYNYKNFAYFAYLFLNCWNSEKSKLKLPNFVSLNKQIFGKQVPNITLCVCVCVFIYNSCNEYAMNLLAVKWRMLLPFLWKFLTTRECARIGSDFRGLRK